MFQEKGIQGAAGSLKKTSVRKKIPHNLTTDSYALRKKQAPKASTPGKNSKKNLYKRVKNIYRNTHFLDISARIASLRLRLPIVI